GGKPKYEGAKWQRFWGDANRLGYTETEAHAALKVNSMNDWLAAGKSLDDATAELTRLAAEASGMEDNQPRVPPGPTPPPGGNDGPQPGPREYDVQVIRSSAYKLGWKTDKKLKDEIKARWQVESIDAADDEKVHQVASRMADLAEAA
ncbi:MAG: hypothetical protein V1771_00660, partial [Chloroflexota bacterium]